MNSDPNKCVVGIRTASGRLLKGFDMLISGEDVYTNYSDCSTPEAHSSYHKSGQYHTKVGGNYIKWDGGGSGRMEPMKLYRTPPGLVLSRVQCWTVGWEISKLDRVLPSLSGDADMTVDATSLEGCAILGFEASVVGREARKQESIVGYPIIASHAFGVALRVEIHAFVVSDEP
jgi:hypothetical protein